MTYLMITGRDDELAKQLGMKEVTSREFATEKESMKIY